MGGACPEVGRACPEVGGACPEVGGASPEVGVMGESSAAILTVSVKQLVLSETVDIHYI